MSSTGATVPVTKIISGGQTGVDRAALDVAVEMGIPREGWCPRGRLAEDGVLPDRYPLRETPRADYEQRTEFNVRDSDGTLILAHGPLSGGTALTKSLARRLGKPCCVLDLGSHPGVVGPVLQWLKQKQIHALNVAGPRESQQPGIYEKAAAFLRQLLRDADC